MSSMRECSPMTTPFSIVWDDLRVILAIQRKGSHAAAGQLLRVDPTTVGRGLAALEAALGAKLFDRTPSGLVATTEGRVLVSHAERAEVEVGGGARAGRRGQAALRHGSAHGERRPASSRGDPCAARAAARTPGRHAGAARRHPFARSVAARGRHRASAHAVQGSDSGGTPLRCGARGPLRQPPVPRRLMLRQYPFVQT